ncbi:hypothetical protein [Jannaschia marina]|uniref:hypothetical protein n=1 Tax=Jannaschia marina TaxID=2741674 RepID=UPI0015C756CD|nr:hypothetical protein [Jannaschia marina]
MNGEKERLRLTWRFTTAALSPAKPAKPKSVVERLREIIERDGVERVTRAEIRRRCREDQMRRYGKVLTREEVWSRLRHLADRTRDGR